MLKKIILLSLVVNMTYADTDIIFKNDFELQSCSQMQCCQATVLFQENFNVANQNWQGYGQWQESGNEVALAEIVNNQARLIPRSSNYSLARMYNPVSTRNAELTFSLFFENALTQGVGLYLRANGGYLQQTVPTGQGYGVFIEKFSQGRPGIGLWYENDGSEISFVRDYDNSYVIDDETEYRVRYQVFQESPTTTRLRARFWQAGTPEPINWQVSVLDSFAPLQNTSGGILVDSWSTQTTGTINAAIRVDDIMITEICNPALLYTAPISIANKLQFAEGPVWHNDRLLFSDIDANTIYQWQIATGVAVVNNTSDNANGLAYNNQNELLAAEYQGDINTSLPNGIALSVNQDFLYWSDTQTGQILQMQVGIDGNLSNMRPQLRILQFLTLQYQV